MYGYQDSGDLTPGKQGGKFGLNTGAFVTKFEFNPNAGKDGAVGDAIDLTVQVGEREYRHRFFPITKVFAKEGGEITDVSSDAYKEALKKELDQFNAVIADVVACFIPREDLKAALATPIPTFKDYANIVTRLVQATPNWQKKPVDVFLQYQWSPSGDNDKTYLELPKNVKHGSFIVASEGVGFKEVKTPTSLKYVKEDGTEHTFKRGEWFLESAFANQINLTGGTTMNSANTAGTSASW
jgi:hypothetical protein